MFDFKKCLKIFGMCILVVTMGVFMFSCNSSPADSDKLEGKFEEVDKIAYFTFSGYDVTLTAAGIDLKGTYKIEKPDKDNKSKRVIITLKTTNGDDIIEGIFENENSFYLKGTSGEGKMIYTKIS